MQSKQREIEYVQKAVLLELLDLYFDAAHKVIPILGTRRQPTQRI